MANRIIKKWIAPDQIDGSKILFLNNEYFRAKAQDGSIKSLFQFTSSDEFVFPDAPLILNPSEESGAIQTKSQVETIVQFEADLRIQSDAALDSRLQVLEAKGFSNGMTVIGEELSFIDLDRAYATLLFVSVGRLAVHEGEDFTLSIVDGKTRLTWINSRAHPDGIEKVETGEKVFWAGAF